MYFSDLVDSIVLMDSTDCAGMRDSAELTDSMYSEDSSDMLGAIDSKRPLNGRYGPK